MNSIKKMTAKNIVKTVKEINFTYIVLGTPVPSYGRSHKNKAKPKNKISRLPTTHSIVSFNIILIKKLY